MASPWDRVEAASHLPPKPCEKHRNFQPGERQTLPSENSRVVRLLHRPGAPQKSHRALPEAEQTSTRVLRGESFGGSLGSPSSWATCNLKVSLCVLLQFRQQPLTIHYFFR